MGYSKFWGLQQRRFVAVSLAAGGSFLLGVVMPSHERMTQPQVSTINVSTQTQASEGVANEVEDPAILSLRDNFLDAQEVIASQVVAATKIVEELEIERFSSEIPERFQGKTISKEQLKIQEKIVALTFDDGPWPESTEQILNILKENEIKATFFIIGKHLKAFPEIGKKVVADGHIIANHTWAHPTGNMSRERAQNEIENTAKLVEELTGIKTNLFRPPGGVLTNGLVEYAEEKKYANIMWSADSMDWRASEANLIKNVLSQVTPGGIILLHDGGGDRSKTVKALPNIINKLKEQGYQFVTVPELLERLDQEAQKQSPQA